MNKLSCGLLACLASLATLGPAMADTLRLPIGDPARRDRTAPVVLDAITDTRNNELIDAGELARRLADVNILFVGENHTDLDFHRVEGHVIRALHEAGREVFIGLEMFPYTRQVYLDRWTRGQYTEAEFLKAADWYGSWGYRWEYYDEIFRYARDNGLRMFGINAPREVVTKVRMEGFEALPAEDAEHIPTSVDTSSDEHRQLFRASFDADDLLHANMTDEQWEGMIRAQATWDAVMGWNAMQAVQRHGSPNAIIVVLIGAGHVTYGLGAERQIRPLYKGGIASLVPVQIVDHEGQAVNEVQGSYANFVWGLPPATDEQFPSLGVSVAGSLGKQPNKIIQVSEDSIAARAGLQVGDVLLSIDGQPVGALGSLRRIMAGYDWGDGARLELTRGEEKLSMDVEFRRDAE